MLFNRQPRIASCPSPADSCPPKRGAWAQFRLPLMLLVAAPFFAAASQDGCQIIVTPAEPEAEPDVSVCDLECEFGLKTDQAGNEYCECIEDEACDAVVPPPHANPETGECVAFSSPCNIPNGWEPCSEGCLVDGEVVPSGASFQSPDGCGDCRCRSDGAVICDDTCDNGCTVDGETYPAGSSFPAPDGCNTCFCDADGSYGCTEIACNDGCYIDDTYLRPGESYDDGCNTCYCDGNGALACTDAICGTCEFNGGFYEAGEQFPAGDGCNTCFCDEGGGVSCTEAECETCEYNGAFYETGEEFAAGDGCNTCFCGEGGSVSCTERACTECLIACEFGFKEDIDGNQYCECRESDACIEIAPAPHFDPNDADGSCIVFPSVCDIPNSFLPCEQAEPVRCTGEVACDALPPECAEGEVPSIEGACWGDCVDEARCEQ